MAKDVNIVVLVGRLTRDPDLKYLNTGTAVLNFSVAVNKTRKDANGNWGSAAMFFDVAYFGKGAEAVAQYLHKGKQIAVDGSLEWQSWQKDGQNRTKVSVLAQNVQLLGSREDGGQRSNQGPYYQQEPYPQNQKPRSTGYSSGNNEPAYDPNQEFEDDIPFN